LLDGAPPLLAWEPELGEGDPEAPLAPELDEELLDDDWLELLLEDEVLELDELDEEELLDELDELLEEDDDALEGGDGMVGGWGVVGVLALGQPVRIATQAPPAIKFRSSCNVRSCSPLGNVIGPAKSFRLYRQTVTDARTKRSLAQATHDVVGHGVVLRIFIEAGEIDDPTPLRDPEF